MTAAMLYAGVLNDKEFGGVFISHDAGQTWKQISDGLDGRDVFVLRQAADNSLIAGTDHGIFALTPNAFALDRRVIRSSSQTEPHRSCKKAVHRAVAAPSELNARVTVLEWPMTRWFAATSTGLFVQHGFR